MYLEIIKKLSEKRNGGLKKLAVDVGMSEQNLHRCIRNNKIQASDLEKIAGLLNVDISTFFDGDHSITAIKSAVSVGGNATNNIGANTGNTTNSTESVETLRQRVELLQQLLEEKERTIKILMNK